MGDRTLEEVLWYENWENESLIREHIIKTDIFKKKYPNIVDITFSEEETTSMNWFVVNHWDKFYIIKEELKLNDSICLILCAIEYELMKRIYPKGLFKEKGYLERENIFSILPIEVLIKLSKSFGDLELEEDTRVKRMLKHLEGLFEIYQDSGIDKK